MTATAGLVRGTALRLLDGVTAKGHLLPEMIDRGAFDGLDAPDRARAQRLVLDTLRGVERADRLLDRFLRKRPPLQVCNLLRLGTVELCNGGDAHGVVNDLVTLAEKNPRTRQYKAMINAVLRRVADEGVGPWKDLRVPRLPNWLRGPLVQAWGNGAVAGMEKAHFAGAPVDLTVKEDAAGWAQKLGGQVLPTGSVRLSAPGQISALEGYETGDWWVQDAAAALPVRLLDPHPGEKVLDLCAAPGGKTLQLAAAGADVTALDLSEKRMERVRENLSRTGLTATCVVGDALDHQGQYDAILLDAPCSATGTIRRHPDLPFAKDGSEFGGLIELQARMLAHALTLLKPGGRLVFCTCSLLPDEGEVQVDEILDCNPDLAVDPAAFVGIEDKWRSSEGGLRLRPDFWPDLGGMDGFYMARLRKG